MTEEQPLSQDEREAIIEYVRNTMRLSGLDISREEAERVLDEVYNSDEPLLVEL